MIKKGDDMEDLRQPKSELMRERETRLQRMRDIEGMTFHTIIEFGLVKRSDWEEVTGAYYPRNRDWKKRRDGSIYFAGKCGTNVYTNPKKTGRVDHG
jgi:hypothetical protein